MAEMYGVKQLHDMKIIATTARNIKEYAKQHGLMDELGKITEKGKEHISYKHRKYDGAEYIAITEQLARKMYKEFMDDLRKKYPGKV